MAESNKSNNNNMITNTKSSPLRTPTLTMESRQQKNQEFEGHLGKILHSTYIMLATKKAKRKSCIYVKMNHVVFESSSTFFYFKCILKDYYNNAQIRHLLATNVCATALKLHHTNVYACVLYARLSCNATS